MDLEGGSHGLLHGTILAFAWILWVISSHREHINSRKFQKCSGNDRGPKPKYHGGESPVLSSHLHLGLQTGLLPSRLLKKFFYTFLISSMHATYPVHFILLEFITIIIFGEAYKL
jgi:hypothetical protein